ncbi:MAG: lipoate--protein ligase family protein [Limnochordales bacterium]|nr:lipoate--protein ligase family protein [Limnochordales bacterium]
MAVDEAILREVGAHRAPPTLRLYSWARPTLSLGANQGAEVVNRERLQALGYDLVRRPSGGRAVLHDREVTYSVVLPLDLPELPAGVIASYRYLSRALLAGLTRLGVPVDLYGPHAPFTSGAVRWAERSSAEEEASGSRRGRGRAAGAACFASSSWYELIAGGRKLVGSAQVRRYGGLLQHGSILLHLDEGLFLSLLNHEEQDDHEEAIRALRGHATALDRVLGREVAWQEVADAVVAGFCQALGITLEPGTLTAREQELALMLEGEKYGSDSWTLRRCEFNH